MNDFQQHLKRIELAKTRAGEILNVWSPDDDITVASLAFAWERIFDTLCSSDEISISDLNTITGVIQKLSAIYGSVKQDKPVADTKSAALQKEIIRQAEEQLSLL